MHKTNLVLILAVIQLNLACGQQKRITTNQKPHKSHVYAFNIYYPGLKPHHRISHDVLHRFRTLSIANYSLIQLFSLAVGGGTLIPEENIVIESMNTNALNKKYCYQIIIDIKDANYLYRMMLASLHGQFKGYHVGIQYREKKRLLVIRDR